MNAKKRQSLTLRASRSEKKLINNVLKATELTIWMVSILHSSARTDSLPSSSRFYHLPLNVPKLASLSLAWHAVLLALLVRLVIKTMAVLPGIAISTSF